MKFSLSRIFKNERLILLSFIFLFLLVRSVNFSYHLNFTNDQALFSTKALEILESKKIVLIGPPISINLNGRQIFQGPATYYETLFFLALGNFDPISSSYAFTIFCALMIIPLFYGAKLLLNKKSALILVLIYSLLPFYINYTRFLWNPNFQFSLLPILILLMGLYKNKPTKVRFFLISFLLGILFQFHFQFLVIIAAIFIFYFLILRIKTINLITFFFGLAAGAFPLILFELRNQFYNTNTLILFVKNYHELSTAGNTSTPHYLLSISFILILGILGLLNFLFPKIRDELNIKYKQKIAENFFYISFVCITFVLFAWAVLLNFPRPAQSFWSSTSNWNYLDERKAYDIIKEENLKNYNVADLSSYDTLATVIKYLMKKDKIEINFDDYYHNRYLFVIYNSSDFSKVLSYEVAFFKPRKILKSWKINDTFSLYLMERLTDLKAN